MNKNNEIRLNVSDLFFKPLKIHIKSHNIIDINESMNDISNNRSKLDDIMTIYELLYQSNPLESSKYFLFPVGHMCLPANDKYSLTCQSKTLYNALYNKMKLNFGVEFICDHSQLLTFNDLKVTDGWTNNKPLKCYHSSYLKQIKHAVMLMNKAKVVHNDLRPRNVLWRIVKILPEFNESIEITNKKENENEIEIEIEINNEFEVEIQIIDFEDSVIENDLYYPTKIEITDNRYPFFRNEENGIIIGTEKNEWFVIVIQYWLQSDIDSFDDFMNSSNVEVVLMEYQALSKSKSFKCSQEIILLCL